MFFVLSTSCPSSRKTPCFSGKWVLFKTYFLSRLFCVRRLRFLISSWLGDSNRHRKSHKVLSPKKKMRISFNASSKGTMLFSKTSKKKICVFDCFYYQYQVEIYRFVHAYTGCGPPRHRIANEGFGWNPRTYTVTCHLGWPGGSAWATLAVALDDPRVSTWRLEVGSFFFGGKNHFNWLTASGLAILIKQ